MRYVVFLRAINVGGHFVKKETLQAAFTALGLQNVTTYKQSSNVIFETDQSAPETIKNKVEAKLQSTLGYSVAAFVGTIPQLKQTIKAAPVADKTAEGTSILVTFLPNALTQFRLQLPLTIPKSTAKIISSFDREVFSETHGGGEGGLPNPFLEAKLKVKATTRNMNTIREIVQKYQET